MIVAIMVNYNGYSDTIEAIESLKKQNYEKNYKIIVVDNCSTNNSYGILKKKYFNDKKVEIILSDKNGGFSYGNNYGIEYALNQYKELQYFLLINNDTVSKENLFSTFEKYYARNKEKENIGILTGKIYYFDSKNILWFAGGILRKKRGGGIHIGEGENDSDIYNEIKKIDFCTGCLMFFEKSLLNETGLLPEEYFMYFEDVDFSWNVIEKGKSIIYLPEAVIWHKVGKSSDILKSKKNYELFNRNRTILAKKYLNKTNFLLFKIYMYIGSSLKFLKHLVKEKKIVNSFKGL